MIKAFEVSLGIQRFYVDALGCGHNELVWVTALEFLLCGLSPVLRTHVVILRVRRGVDEDCARGV
jgi:hypothetical protein